MEMTKDKYQEILEKAELIYDADQINAAMDEMGKQITARIGDKNPIILTVMTGALIFTGNLVLRFPFSLEMDYIHATRYRGTNRGGDLHWQVEPRINLKDRTILVVDDILDGGITMGAIMDYCQQAGAKEVLSAVLIDKKRVREPGIDFEPDFVGLTAENKYLFGYGLDYEEYLRNVPGIYAVND